MVTQGEVKIEHASIACEHFGMSLPIGSSNNEQLKHQERREMNGLGSNGSSGPNSPVSMDGCGRLNETLSSVTAVADAGSLSGEAASALSTIAILRRHPMYDSLVLVKRPHQRDASYSLELPTSEFASFRGQMPDKPQHHPGALNGAGHKTNGHYNPTKLVSVYLDGDDPMYQIEQERYSGPRDDGCEIVYVPLNGLLHRLDNYEKQGIVVDSRVYAFAMGLKTAEKFLTSSNQKELQETPPL